MQIIPASELVRTCFRAYETKDRAALERLLADDFTFSSPYDDNISREEYFLRCWPNSEHLRAFQIERCFSEGGEVFVTYTGEHMDGSTFRNTEFFVTTGAHIKHVDVYFGTEIPEEGKDSETEVRAVIDETVRAIRVRDAEALMECYAAGVVAFDLLPPLRYEGEVALQKRADEWLGSFTCELEFELQELRIVSGAACAFAHSLNHVRGTRPGGEVVDMWWRATLGLEKLADAWKITHAHSSEPFNMETGLAETGLKP
jgi:ketosteroid isomerase-like protein